MTNAMLASLIIREGLPVALQIASIIKAPAEEVTPETLERLQEIAGRTATDYERERQG